MTFSEYKYNYEYVKYELALIDFPFDKDSQDTAYFENQTEQRAYFESFSSRFIEIETPNLDTLNNTTQITTGNFSLIPNTNNS